MFDRLLVGGATIIVIGHDLDLLAAADHLIDIARAAAWTAGASSPPGHRPTSLVLGA